MQNPMIKSHRPNQMYLGHYLFILNKGLNSGKPMYEPCPNCFVLICNTAQERESHYWLSYSLWQAKFWHQHLVGSVIPFLRLGDFKKELQSKCRIMLQEQDAHAKSIRALQLLEQKEAKFHKNLTLINDMKRAILYRYITKK